MKAVSQYSFARLHRTLLLGALLATVADSCSDRG